VPGPHRRSTQEAHRPQRNDARQWVPGIGRNMETRSNERLATTTDERQAVAIRTRAIVAGGEAGDRRGAVGGATDLYLQGQRWATMIEAERKARRGGKHKAKYYR
jgi:hypothetical protein